MIDEHVWVRAPDGTVIDPTGDQFGGPHGPVVVPPDDFRQADY